MDVLFVTHSAFGRHETGRWHPERPARLEAVERGVMSAALRVTRVEAPEVDRDVLARVHDVSYIRGVEEFCASGGGAFDADTYVVPASWPAALRAAGAGLAAVEGLAQGLARTAFVSARPPGHHATRNAAMGFCIFNNVAVTARALTDGGARVAIVDWDVHHGNGTQSIFDEDPEVLYISFHQNPLYPGGGALTDTGSGAGRGTIVNIPVPPRTAGDVFSAAFEGIIGPVIRQFAPDWILVSAGFDGHEDDPLAELRLVAGDYGRASGILDSLAPGRVAFFLEGGYHLPAITASVAASLRGAVLRSGGEPGLDSPEASWTALAAAESVARRHWQVG
ncbi:MAG: histone deacetylase [Acidimicrobiia bacterium]|nr:histone deacetylase [Acidimicrobiia bacterium]MDH5616291.1 histone deacetylase [Acidimicrobiia bacterium]